MNTSSSISLKDCLCRELGNLLKVWDLDYLNNLSLTCEEKLWVILKILRYWIIPTQYEIFISKELREKLKRGYFYSLSVEKALFKKNPYIEALKQLIFYLQMGYNVNSFLSKNNFPPTPIDGKRVKKKDIIKWLNTSKGDKLLIDWNIYHFHLSPFLCRNGLRCRSDILVFAFKYRNAFFFLDALTHKEASDEKFASLRLLEILFENWYFLKDVIHTVLKGVLNVKPKITNPHDIYNFRKAAINTVYEINTLYGKFFMMSLDGFTSAGIPISVIRDSNRILNATFGKFINRNCNLKVLFYKLTHQYTLKFSPAPIDFEIPLTLPF